MENICKGFTYTRKGVVLPELPQEVITQVLMRLPVKSLLRFRCVSKSFRTIIDDRYFIKSHLNCYAKDKSQLKFIIIQWSQITANSNSAKIHCSDFGIGPLDGLDVRGYCNGVFLLSVHKYLAALWNPSTNHYRLLPRLPDHTGNFSFYVMWMGLGYDSYQDDYKVVVINDFRVDSLTFKGEYRVWIFGLRSNSWKRVCTDFFSSGQTFWLSYDGYFADGYLHWPYTIYITKQRAVLAFDMAKETLSVLVHMPAYHKVGKLPDLNVIDGCLCVSYFTSPEAVLYVRKKDGDEFTWCLLYSVLMDQLPPFLKEWNFLKVGVLGHSKESDKIMLDLGLTYVVSYDLKKNSFQPTKIKIGSMFMGEKTRSFVESLVPVHATDA